MMALGYAVFYLPLTYFIGHPVNWHWLGWPVLGVAVLTLWADWKGIGDHSWFVRTLTGLIIAVAIIGAILS